MTHELHLGTVDSSRNKGLALIVNDQEESECDEEEAAMMVRKFKKIFRNSKYANQRNNKQKSLIKNRTSRENRTNKVFPIQLFPKINKMSKLKQNKMSTKSVSLFPQLFLQEILYQSRGNIKSHIHLT
jgi:hypothetical protein